MGVSRNLSSSTARSTPESTTATATPSPVARGSRRMASGVSSANIWSNTVGVAIGQKAIHHKGTKEAQRATKLILSSVFFVELCVELLPRCAGTLFVVKSSGSSGDLVEQFAQVVHHAHTVGYRRRAVPQRE